MGVGVRSQPECPPAYACIHDPHIANARMRILNAHACISAHTYSPRGRGEGGTWDSTQAHTPPASTITEHALPATIKERVMRTRDPWSGGAHGEDGRYNAWRSGAPGPHAHGNAARQVVDDWRAEVHGQQKPSNDPPQQPARPRYANYRAPLTHKQHPPHPAQPQHTNHLAPRTRKRHQREHRPQRPTERSDPTQHAKGRTGDCPGPRKETATRRHVTRGGGGGGIGWEAN